MVRILAICSLVFGAQAFAAPATSTKTSAKGPSSKASASKSQSGKSSVSLSDVRPTHRGFRIVPMLGMASFRLIGADGLDEVRADEGLALSVLGDYDYGRVTLQGGLSYYQVGARGTVKSNIGPISTTVMLDYIALNAGAKYYFNNRQIYAKGGLSPLINTRSDVKATSPVTTTQKLNNVRDMDILLTLGGGVEFPFYKDVRVGGELSYNRGLIDATTNGNGEVFNEGFLFSAFVNL